MKLKDYVAQSKNEKFNDAFLKLVDVVKENIPEGFEWGFGYGMPGYDVPFSLYPDGYHCNPEQPLPFIGLAIQKQHIGLYHMGIYMDDDLLNWFTKEYADLNIGKLDMGKSCIRLKNPNKIPYDLIGELVTKITPEEYIKRYQESLSMNK